MPLLLGDAGLTRARAVVCLRRGLASWRCWSPSGRQGYRTKHPLYLAPTRPAPSPPGPEVLAAAAEEGPRPGSTSYDRGSVMRSRAASLGPGHGAAGSSGGRGEAGRRSGPLRDRERGSRGRGPGSGAGDARTDRVSGITHLPTLVAIIEENAPKWSAARDVSSLRAAFLTLAKLGSRPGTDTRLLPRALTTLAAAYVPLVPGLRDAFSCTGPLYACAKLGFWEGQLAAALLERLGLDGGELLQRADGKGHGNLWWSVSVAPKQLVALAEGALQVSSTCLTLKNPSQLASQSCSNILLACARLQRRHDPLLHHLTACLVQLPDAECQHLANSLYALGELAEDCGHKPRKQDLQRLGGRVLERMQQQQGSGRQNGSLGNHDSFTPQHLSNMLLGCAKLGFSDPGLLHSLAAALGCCSQLAREQELANSLYALAVMGCTGPQYTSSVKQLYAEVLHRLHSQPSRFVPQELSNILWALERLQPDGMDTLVQALAAECRRRQFVSFKPQDLSNTAWALAKMGYSDQDWYEAVVTAASAPGAMQGARPQEWANLWYALALVRHRPPDSFLEATARDGLPCASPQECANLLWSLASLGLYDQRLVDALGERLGELLGEKGREGAKKQNLANSLWALAVMGPDVLSRHSGLLEGLLIEVVRRWEQEGSDGFTRGELAQLWQVQQELGKGRARGRPRKGAKKLELILAGDVDGQDREMLQAMRAAAEEERLDPTTSELQQAVVRVLQQLQSAAGQDSPLSPASSSDPSSPILAILPEHPVEALCCRVDVVVELAGGRRVAVEVDGPWHFLANHPHTGTKTGRTQLRDRQLERVFGAGNVVSVPYWEWDALRRGKERQHYLGGLLGVGVP
ncbi:hypothetical protein Agub_g2106 [Astrephomene gubernaculifera]|uniref:RAP domain-containing protein n=1 Tax=Astrephomene gubernaculifera TaxID=47775 RepID=A0AAD3HI48_9CHLO|nr:hypothetical protein Agub_g2106 [Astrephomene gubernaculifera]